MENLRAKIGELIPKSYFLDQAVLQNIQANLNNFSEAELQNIYDLLQKTNEKTVDHFDTMLQKNPKFFEDVKIELLHKKESILNEQDLLELKEIENLLATI